MMSFSKNFEIKTNFKIFKIDYKKNKKRKKKDKDKPNGMPQTNKPNSTEPKKTNTNVLN